MKTVNVKTVAYNAGVYKIWSVDGKVTMAKCAKTGKFVGNVMASNALWHNRNNADLSPMQTENLIIVNCFKQIKSEINWFAICGSLFFAMLFVLICVFAVVMFTINPSTVFLSGLIVAVMGAAFTLIIDNNSHVTVSLA